MASNKDLQREFYNSQLDHYDSAVVRVHRSFGAYTIETWKPYCAGADILDIGCGNAFVLDELNGHPFHSYTGIDISDRMIAHNKQRYANWKGVHFIREDAESLLQIRDSSFDVIVSHGCLHHLEHPPKAISAIRQKLRPGGRFFAMEMNRKHPAASFVGFWAYFLGLDPFRVRRSVHKLLGMHHSFDFEDGETEWLRTSDYQANHPGHPGLLSPDEYRGILAGTGFQDITVKCLFLDLLPYPIYMSFAPFFHAMVWAGRPLLRLRKFKNVGSVVLIEARVPGR